MPTTFVSDLERRLAELGEPSYAHYLCSDHWAKKREEFTKSGRPRECFICGRLDVHLHHRSYNALGEEPLDHLIPLCPDHHYEVHKFERRYRGWDVGLANAHAMYQEEFERRRGRRPTSSEVIALEAAREPD